jgi:GT2 family glycosyltransferase
LPDAGVERAMSVAVAMPNRDQGRFLPQALESLLGQADVDLQIAVLDAGSRDDSVAILRRWEDRLAYWRSTPDAGQSSAINEGLGKLGPTEFVGWLNADDLLLPGALGVLSQYLDRHPECVAAFGRAHVIDESGRIVGEFPTRPFSRRALARTSIICQPASLIRRRAWEAVGGLDESLHMCMDYDLWWRLSRLGPIGFVSRTVACSRDHASTKTRAHQDRLYREAFAVVRRHVGYVPWRWCANRAAFEWRAAHDGRRPAGIVQHLVRAGRAVRCYATANRVAGLVRALGPRA